MSKTVETVFSEWAREGRGDRMAEGHWPRTKQIIDKMGIRSGMHCVDVGCGNGYAVRAMAESAGPTGHVLGVDFSGDMIAVAGAHADNPAAVLFREAAAEHLPLEAESVDRLLSIEMLYYATHIPLVLKEWHRVLKQGGSAWLMLDFYKENKYCHTWPADLGVAMTLWGEDEYRKALTEAGFSNIAFDRVFDPRPVDTAGFTPGWGYNTPDDVVDFRTRVGGLLIEAHKG